VSDDGTFMKNIVVKELSVIFSVSMARYISLLYEMKDFSDVYKKIAT